MKKNTFTRVLSILMVAIMMFAVGCNKPEASGGAQTLNIYVLEQGYGKDWAYKTKDAFMAQDWVKDKYPELKINITPNDQVTFAGSQLGLGNKTKFDLLFGAYIGTYIGTDAVEDLTEIVYNAKVPGENITYKEKLNESVVASRAYYDMTKEELEPQYFSVPYTGGRAGFLYNEEALESYDLSVPNTTDEFYQAAVTIRNANQSKYDSEDPTAQYVFQQSNDAPYWQKHGFQVWWAQYEGVEGYENFYNGIVNEQRSIDIFKQKGRLESLKVFEKLLDYDENFIHPSSFDEKFMIAQTAFLQGSAVFHFNGDWFTDEMKEIRAQISDLPTIKMMKTPIVSSIVEKCTTIKGENGGTADKELSALITAIDAGSKSLTGEGYNVNQKDFNKIFDARRIVNLSEFGTAGDGGVIPSASDAKELAADFLLFMATDEGIAAYCEGASGSTIDFKIDLKAKNPELYNSLQPAQQGRIDEMLNPNNPPLILKGPDAFPLYVYGGVKPFVDMSFEGIFKGRGNTITAEDIYNNTIDQWTNVLWQRALQNAGLAN